MIKTKFKLSRIQSESLENNHKVLLNYEIFIDLGFVVEKIAMA
jgi:hypothetical protein